MHSRLNYVTNGDELLQHGNAKGRSVALRIIENTLEQIDSYRLVKRIVRIEKDEKLVVDSLCYDLSKVKNLFVVGAGKATFPMAQALEEILGKRIKKGTIVVKRGEKRRLKHIEVLEAGHPIPDMNGLRGAKKIVAIAKEAKKGDLVFCLITGGASALLPLTADGIRLDDKRKITNLLLKCGAKIDEINTVRNHLSAIKAGRLAMEIHPAETVSLVVIDEAAGLPWGPTVPDETTFSDAVSVLKRYAIWEKVPQSVKDHLSRADPKEETPKAEDFRNEGIVAHNVILADSDALCEAAEKASRKIGYKPLVLSSTLEGESKEVGIALSSVAREIERKGKPIKPPCVVIVGGETTVTISEEHGEGGRNQEFALAASLKISGSQKIVIASIGTDGTDGPTDIAGAIVDGYTVQSAKAKQIDVYEHLQRHNASHVFRELGDAIFTGPTGTNVMDLRLLVVT